MTAQKFYAHSLENKPQSEWQMLDVHLTEVANLAAKFAKKRYGQMRNCLRN